MTGFKLNITYYIQENSYQAHNWWLIAHLEIDALDICYCINPILIMRDMWGFWYVSLFPPQNKNCDLISCTYNFPILQFFTGNCGNLPHNCDLASRKCNRISKLRLFLVTVTVYLTTATISRNCNCILQLTVYNDCDYFW